MHSINSMFDTVAELGFMQKDIFKEGCLKARKANNWPALRNKNDQNVSIFETVKLQVGIGCALVKVVISALTESAVDVLLRISFIDRFVKGDFHPERKIVP